MNGKNDLALQENSTASGFLKYSYKVNMLFEITRLTKAFFHFLAALCGVENGYDTQKIK